METVPGSKGPVIGIVADSEKDAGPHADLVERSGGIPRLMVPGQDGAPLGELHQVAGLVVAGGGQFGPETADGPRRIGRAGETPPDAARVAPPLLEAALAADMPVLAVGRGMHALNAALGGTPAGGLEGHGPSEQDGVEASAYHRIFISPGTRLAAIVGSGGFVRVNSRHRLGIRDAQRSPLLMASAYSLDDGVVEAVESPDHGWVIGVQFRPELRLEIPPHFDRLFQSLVERAYARSA
jgi:putative glutamine amidotransferase